VGRKVRTEKRGDLHASRRVPGLDGMFLAGQLALLTVFEISRRLSGPYHENN
jgi:hypothetical protein